MRCPHCGFHNLEPKERCVRCRKPLDGEPLIEAAPEESSDGLKTGESFTFTKPPLESKPEKPDQAIYSEREESLARSPDYSGSILPVAELSPESAPDEGSLIPADTESGSIELTIEREPEPPESASAPDDEDAPSETKAEESEVTVDLSDDDTTSGETKTPDRSEVEAAPAPALSEAEIVAALVEEITPAPLPASDEESGRGQAPLDTEVWKEAEELLRAAGPEPEQMTEASSGAVSEPLDLPGDATAAAMRQIMALKGEQEDGGVEAQEPEPPLPEVESPETSASTGWEEKKLDKFFEESADEAVAAPPVVEEAVAPAPVFEEDDSQIEIKPLALKPPPGHDPHPLELPLADQSEPSHPSLPPGKGLRAARSRNRRSPANPVSWLLIIRRAGSGVFDLAVWAALAFFLYKAAVLVNGLNSLHGTAWEWARLVAIPLLIMAGVLALVYGSLFGSIIGRTPGMMIFGLKLSAPDGNRPALSRAFLRTAVFILSVIPMGAGIFISLFAPKGAFHDRLSGIKVEKA
jgi:uncharacterized RDD family membrane protein YckC